MQVIRMRQVRMVAQPATFNAPGLTLPSPAIVPQMRAVYRRTSVNLLKSLRYLKS